LYKEQFWHFYLQVNVRRKKLPVAAFAQNQAAKIAKGHFEPQNTDTAIRIDHQCL
jgi:hypothetical protein